MVAVGCDHGCMGGRRPTQHIGKDGGSRMQVGIRWANERGDFVLKGLCWRSGPQCPSGLGSWLPGEDCLCLDPPKMWCQSLLCVSGGLNAQIDSMSGVFRPLFICFLFENVTKAVLSLRSVRIS